MSKMNQIIVIENGVAVVNEISLEQLKAIKAILGTTTPVVEEPKTEYKPEPEMKDYDIVWNNPVKQGNGTYVLSLKQNIPYHVFTALKESVDAICYTNGVGFIFKDAKAVKKAQSVKTVKALKDAPKRQRRTRKSSR